MLLILIMHLYWSGVWLIVDLRTDTEKGIMCFKKGQTMCSKDVNHSSSLVNMIEVPYLIIEHDKQISTLIMNKIFI